LFTCTVSLAKDIYFPKFDINKDFQLLEEKEGLNKDLKFTVYGRVK